MNKLKPLIFATLLLSSSAFASIVAIVDSGVDINHPELQNRLWVNSEDPINGVDDDLNGYLDDYNGWNFTANNNEVINYNYQGLVDDEAIRYFMEMQEGITSIDDLSQEQQDWIKNIMAERPDFFKDVMTFGTYIHGTHVAGIAALGNDAKIMSIKLLQTDVNDVAKSISSSYMKANSKKKGMKVWIMEKLIGLVAKTMSSTDKKVGNYLKSHQVDVMNGSYGIGYLQAQQVAKTLLGAVPIFKDPTEKEIDRVARAMSNQLIDNAQKYVATAPSTLFVFAAGNDGMNNDKFPNSPSNVRSDNSISVAATVKFSAIAAFSNYGVETVDIAAPGVGISSHIPGAGSYKLSGTSQAAPFVANVAARVKDENPKLMPVQIKKILMATVTKKLFLAGKVKSGGIVNMKRAVLAAKLSRTLNVNEAINKANNRHMWFTSL